MNNLPEVWLLVRRSPSLLPPKPFSMPHQTCKNDNGQLFCFKLHFVLCSLKWLSINTFQLTCSIPCVNAYSRSDSAKLMKPFGPGHWSASDDVLFRFLPKTSACAFQAPVKENGNNLVQKRKWKQPKGEFYSLLTSVTDTSEVRMVDRRCWGLMCNLCVYVGLRMGVKLHRHAFHCITT